MRVRIRVCRLEGEVEAEGEDFDLSRVVWIRVVVLFWGRLSYLKRREAESAGTPHPNPQPTQRLAYLRRHEAEGAVPLVHKRVFGAAAHVEVDQADVFDYGPSVARFACVVNWEVCHTKVK